MAEPEGSFTAWLISSLTRLNSTASLHTNNNILSLLVKSDLVKMETSHTVLIPPTMRECSLLNQSER